MRIAAAAIVLAVLGAAACSSTDNTQDAQCGGAQTCGFYDHKYFATFACPMSMGYSYRDENDCLDECTSAAAFGCSTNGCAAGCATDHGTGQWFACTSANNATETSSGCFLSGSGVNGETVPCVCR